MTIASTLSALEAGLVGTLALRARPLAPALARCEGVWRGQPASIRATAYEGGGVRYARFVEVRGEGLEIANVLCLPDPSLRAPMLGVDLVHARAGHPVVVADLLPGDEGDGGGSVSSREPAAALPRWAEQFFSPDALVLRPALDRLDAAVARAVQTAWTFRDRLQTAPRDPGRAPARARWQDAYCHAHRRDDRALGMLARIFGDDWAARFTAEVLFPVAVDDGAELAMTRLRAATRQAHAAVEAQVGLMDDTVTVDDYRWFLAATAACAIPLEAQVASLAPAAVPIGCVERPRARWLTADLRTLQVEVAPPVAMAPLANWAQAVGAAYVLEGATLGGQVLLRHLTGRLNLPDGAFSYLRSYGERSGERWRECRSYAGAFMAQSGDAEREVIAGALATFRAFTTAYAHR